MVIFDAHKLNPLWTEGEFPGTKYGLSDNGWINTDLFEAWLSEHFLEHAVSARPVLLLLDGHNTHYQPELLRSVVCAPSIHLQLQCLKLLLLMNQAQAPTRHHNVNRSPSSDVAASSTSSLDVSVAKESVDSVNVGCGASVTPSASTGIKSIVRGIHSRTATAFSSPL